MSYAVNPNHVVDSVNYSAGTVTCKCKEKIPIEDYPKHINESKRTPKKMKVHEDTVTP